MSPQRHRGYALRPLCANAGASAWRPRLLPPLRNRYRCAPPTHFPSIPRSWRRRCGKFWPRGFCTFISATGLSGICSLYITISGLSRHLPRAMGGLCDRSICHVFWGSLRFLVTGFLFSMFSASFLEKALFRPFVFKMFSASYTLSVHRHNADMQSVRAEARKMWHHPSLLAPRAGRADLPPHAMAGPASILTH